jgi:hypothetical protein
MSLRPSRIAIVALSLLLATCTNDSSVTPPLDDIDVTFDIGDGANSGPVDGFYWLSPTVKKSQKNFDDPFDPNLLSLNPTIEICKINGGTGEGFEACEGYPSHTAIRTLSSASHPEIIRLDADKEDYSVTWQSTNGGDIQIGMTYRAVLSVVGVVLGWVDLEAVAKQRDLKDVGPGFSGFVVDNNYLFKWRVETGIAGAVVVTPPGAMIFDADTPGESVAYTATVTDLYANPLPGVDVGWESSHPANADVDPATTGPTDGLGQSTTTASSDGLTPVVANTNVTITATVGAASGSETLIVKPSLGTLKVIKDSGSDGTFDFTGSGGIGGAFQISTAGAPVATGMQSFSLLVTTTYDVSETLNPDFDFVSATCLLEGGGGTGSGGSAVTGIVVEPGKTTTCTFVNAQKPGALKVIKNSDADGSFDFSATSGIGAFQLNTTGQPAATDMQTFSGLDATVDVDLTETPNPAFDFVSAVCLKQGGGATGAGGPSVTGIDIEPGKTTTCTFTNMQKLGSLKVVKNSDVNGGFDFTSDLGAFTLNTVGGGPSTAMQTFGSLNPNVTYSVTETLNPEFNFGSASCVLEGGGPTGTPGGTSVTGIVIEGGKTTTCTFTNTVKPGSLKVVKNSGADGSFDFTGDLGNFTLNTTGAPAATAMQTFGSLDASMTFDITESANVDFDFVSVACTLQGGGATGTPGASTVTGVGVEPGKTTTCTFTNQIQPGSLTVIKNSDADATFNFTGTGAVGAFALTTVGAPSSTDQTTFNSLDAAVTYDLTETLNPAFDLDLVGCTLQGGGGTGTPNATGVTGVALEAGKTTTCTFTNSLRVDAIDDSYNASGNIAIAIPDGPTDVVENNDIAPAGSVVSGVQGSSANVGVSTATTNGGSVVLLANGSFTYEPPPGFEGTDNFTYTLSNAGTTKTDAATVFISITDMVWFIDGSGTGANTGTFSNPFQSIAAFNSANNLTGAVPDPKNGDLISLASGAYNEADGINLRPDQVLIGAGVAFGPATAGIFTPAANSVAAYQTFAGGTGTAPTITASAGNGIDLATGNTVRGLDIGNTSGTGIADAGSTVGTLTIDDVSITGTGRGFEANNGGFLAVAFDELSSSNAQGIDINGTTGSFDITTGTINSGASNAVSITGAPTLTLGVTLQSVSSSGGSTTGINLSTVSGTFHVTGTGASGSGGTIANKSSTDGIRLNSTGGLVHLEDMDIQDISHPNDGSNTSTVFRSGADGIHGENVNGGLTLDGVRIRRISDNAINGSLFSDGVSATSWDGIQILNSVLELTNRFDVASRGDDQDEGIVRIRGLTGTVRIIASTIQNGARGFDVETLTGAGTMDMTVQQSVFNQIYKELPGPTVNVGIRGISVVVSGSHDGVVRIGDPAQASGALGNVFTNNATASIAVLGQTGHTGDIDVVISRNQFIVNDHLASQGTPGDFNFNFPQGGVALVPDGGTFDAIVSHNTFDQVMHAAGGFGQLTMGFDGGVSQVHVHDNTFTLPWDAALHMRADGSSAGTEVLVEDNIYNDGTVGSGSDALGGPFPSPFQGNFVTVRNGGVLDLTWRDEIMPLNDTGNGTPIPQSFRAQTQNQAGNVLNLSLTNNAAPNGYDLIQQAGTFNLFTTGSCAGPPTPQFILNTNGNTGGGGADGTSPPTVSVSGTITCTTTAPALPSITIP